MSEKPASRWSQNKGLARAILHDRVMRRRVMGYFLLAMMVVFAFGLWGIPGWLSKDPWRFLIYWAVCAAQAVFLVMFAVYDACAVIKEERGKM
jgi:hypothetical protein